MEKRLGLALTHLLPELGLGRLAQLLLLGGLICHRGRGRGSKCSDGGSNRHRRHWTVGHWHRRRGRLLQRVHQRRGIVHARGGGCPIMGAGLRRGRHGAGLLLRFWAGLLLGSGTVLRLPLLLRGRVVARHTTTALRGLLVAATLHNCTT